MNTRLLVFLILFPFLAASQTIGLEEEISSDPLEAYKQCYIQANALRSTKPYEALDLAKKALEYAKEAGMLEKEAKANYLVGSMAYDCRQYQLAYRCMSSAKAEFNQLGDQILEGWSTVGIANIHTIAKQFDSARFFLSEAKTLMSPHISDTEIAPLYRDFGNLLIEEGRYKEAIQELHPLLSLPIKAPVNDAKTSLRIGFCYFKLGQIDSAQYYYEIAFDKSNEVGLNLVAARSAEALGYFAIQRRQYQKVIPVLLQGKAQLNGVWNQFSLRNQIVNNLALCYFREGKPEEGRTLLEDLMQDSLFETGNEYILDTYDLYIDEYMVQYGDEKTLEVAREARKKHRHRIINEMREIGPLVAEQIAIVNTQFAIERMEANNEKRQRWLPYIIGVLAALVGGLFFHLRKKAAAREKALRKENEELKKKWNHLGEKFLGLNL